MKITYINNENKQIIFNGSTQEALDEINLEAVYIDEISLEELKEMQKMINEYNIYKYRNFMEIVLITVLKKLC